MKLESLRGPMIWALGVLVGAVAMVGLSGCGGAEPQKPLPPAASGVPPAGGSVADYKAGMEAAKKKQQ